MTGSNNIKWSTKMTGKVWEYDYHCKRLVKHETVPRRIWSTSKKLSRVQSLHPKGLRCGTEEATRKFMHLCSSRLRQWARNDGSRNFLRLHNAKSKFYLLSIDRSAWVQGLVLFWDGTLRAPLFILFIFASRAPFAMWILVSVNYLLEPHIIGYKTMRSP